MHDIPGANCSLQSPLMIIAVIIRAIIIAVSIALAIRCRTKAKSFSLFAFFYTYAALTAILMGELIDDFLFTLIFIVTHPRITEFGMSGLHSIWLSPAIGLPLGICVGLLIVRRNRGKGTGNNMDGVFHS